ncbi:MAG: M28 family peptidase, partial [Bryobacteraceae bacterium]
MRSLAVFLLAFPFAIAASETAETQAALDRISAQSMRGHLSFLASDLLEGRNSPSRGLDLAAEYIAAQFRRIGLEAAGDDGYFQTAKMVTQEQSKNGWHILLNWNGKEFSLKDSDFSGVAAKPVDFAGLPVFKVMKESDITADLENAVALLDASGRSLLRKVRAAKPAAIVTVSDRKPRIPTRLIEGGGEHSSLVQMYVKNDEWTQMVEALPAGRTEAKLSVTAPGPSETPSSLRNVVGVLRGSDPLLKDTYVFLTAHYDHIGMKPAGEGDRIYNGANDDGSGTVSVIEIAAALAAMEHRPKRSIVFMAVFGEEEGLIGSQYYARHPIFPLAKTVADFNLEQLGRTDDTAGPQVATVSVTG